MSIPATDFVAPPTARWRRTAGLVSGVLCLVMLAGTVLGAWNPASLVLVHQHLGDPVRDLFLAMLLALVGYWVGVPVTSEAAQHGRVAARAWLAVLTALVGLGALTTWGLSVFRYEPQVIARSADGQRAVALVTVLQGRQLHAFAGSGVGARDQGNLGRPCGPSVTAEFTGDDQVEVTTNYGTFDLRLDPATGRPVRGLGPTCSG